MKKINIIKKGLKASLKHDLYYQTIRASWTKFFLVAAFIYLLINFFFACLYFFTPSIITNVSDKSLWELFIFSFQTSSTIGYGFYLPQSNSAHAIVILDALIGIFYVAIITGLAFSKFAKPNAKIIFSNKVLFTQFDGKPAIMFRLANGRDTHVVDAKIKVSALVPYESLEGMKMRRFHNLNLLSDNNAIFALSWTAIHIIEDDSPLKSMSIEKLKDLDVIFAISFTGIDDVLSQQVHANEVFRKDTFVKAKQFKDILIASDNSYTLDMTHFNEVEF